MKPGDHEYRGMLAQTWDLFRGDTSNWADRHYYLGFIEEFGQPVLDIGCATGRLLLDYLSRGIDIDGVDVSPEILAICNEKAGERGLEPNLYLQAVEALDLPRKYRTILVPSSTFQLVIAPEDVREAMRRLYGHLEPGGALVMPFMILWREGQPLEEESMQEVVRPSDGATLRKIARSRYEPQRQLEHTETIFQVILVGEVVDEEMHARSPATRWYTLDQAVELYREAGFQRILAYSGFTRQPYSEGDELFTLVGIK